MAGRVELAISVAAGLHTSGGHIRGASSQWQRDSAARRRLLSISCIFVMYWSVYVFPVSTKGTKRVMMIIICFVFCTLYFYLFFRCASLPPPHASRDCQVSRKGCVLRLISTCLPRPLLFLHSITPFPLPVHYYLLEQHTTLLHRRPLQKLSFNPIRSPA